MTPESRTQGGGRQSEKAQEKGCEGAASFLQVSLWHLSKEPCQSRVTHVSDFSPGGHGRWSSSSLNSALPKAWRLPLAASPRHRGFVHSCVSLTVSGRQPEGWANALDVDLWAWNCPPWLHRVRQNEGLQQAVSASATTVHSRAVLSNTVTPCYIYIS